MPAGQWTAKPARFSLFRSMAASEIARRQGKAHFAGPPAMPTAPAISINQRSARRASHRARGANADSVARLRPADVEEPSERSCRHAERVQVGRQRRSRGIDAMHAAAVGDRVPPAERADDAARRPQTWDSAGSRRAARPRAHPSPGHRRRVRLSRRSSIRASPGRARRRARTSTSPSAGEAIGASVNVQSLRWEGRPGGQRGRNWQLTVGVGVLCQAGVPPIVPPARAAAKRAGGVRSLV